MRVAFLVAWIVILPTAMEAQTTNATVLGTITDSSGAVVPNAAIQVTNTETNIGRPAVTDNEGRFRASDLSIGKYEVRASAPGFQSAVRTGIVLTVGSEVVVDFVLEPGTQQETLTVSGNASRVEANSAAISSLVDERQMRDLPLNGRNFQQLLLLAPGVTQAGAGLTVNGRFAFYGSNYSSGGNYSVSGARTEGQAILLDNTDIQGFWNTGTGSRALGTSLGVDAIAEFQVLTNTYSAQFGGNGAVVNAVTRSGSNTWHGSVYEFLRNNDLDARDFFNDASSPAPFRRNQFGGSLGGPLRKDKLFLFGNYEGLREALSRTALAGVPNANARQGILPGNSTPIPIHPIIKSILDLHPVPNGPDLNAVLGSYTSLGTLRTNENYELLRGDYIVSAKDAFFARYVSDHTNFVDPFYSSDIPLWPQRLITANQYFTVEERRTVSSSRVNLLRFSFVRPVEKAATAGTHPELQFLFPGQGLPDVHITPGGASGLGPGGDTPFALIQNRFALGDDQLWVHGAHSLRFGLSLERIQSNTNSATFPGGSYSFNTFQQFLLGLPAFFTGSPVGADDTTRDFREIALTPYFQDEWKVSRRLTLDLGLRYEYVTDPVGVRHPLNAILNPPFTAGYTTVTHVFDSSPNTKNFDPRFGFALDLLGDHKNSVRGGFGIFHDRVGPRTYALEFWNSPPDVLTNLFAPAFPNPFQNTGGPAQPINVIYSIPYHLRSVPYQMQFNLTVQREILHNTVLSLGYVGARGVHLFYAREANPPVPIKDASGVDHFGTLIPDIGLVVPNPRVNPALGFVSVSAPDGNSHYDSFQARLDRRLTANLTAQASYTFSKCIDNASGTFGLEEAAFSSEDPYDAKYDRGLCNFDLRQNLRVNAVATLPFRGNRFVEGWQLSGILSVESGRPFPIGIGFDQAGFQTFDSAFYERPNVVAGCHAVFGKVDEWYNPACFSLPAPGTLGNLGRNTFMGPGLSNVDFALFKNTRIPNVSDTFAIQIRAEFFNLLNHANFGFPNLNVFLPDGAGGGVVSPFAGRILSTTTPARQIQFGLKLLF